MSLRWSYNKVLFLFTWLLVIGYSLLNESIICLLTVPLLPATCSLLFKIPHLLPFMTTLNNGTSTNIPNFN